ncbi:MAG: ABC transporter substrate-binding protein [Acidobacteria bacterium]|nr:ABC transporter substrate-binding protein [Acidobacteriota bacterium]
MPSLVQLPLILAQELGFFGDEGLDVTMNDMSGGSKALESLLAGSADVVSSFHDQTLLLTAQGRDLKVIRFDAADAEYCLSSLAPKQNTLDQRAKGRNSCSHRTWFARASRVFAH